MKLKNNPMLCVFEQFISIELLIARRCTKKEHLIKNAYLYGTLCPSLVFNPIPIRLKSIEFLTKCEAWKLECFTM